MSSVEVIVYADAEELVQATARRLVDRIVAAQSASGSASIVLTGGGTGGGVLKAVNDLPDRDAVDWSAVHIWWGDERFVAAASEDRNDVQARAALLDHVGVDPARVHQLPARDGTFGDDPDAAARWYESELAAAADGGLVPHFDVLMLGLGEEGHTASIFPDSPAAHDQGIVCAVRDCPKPPPTRVSMTFRALVDTSTEVWMMTTGAGKAQAVAKGVQGADRISTPAAGPRGTDKTLWLVDTAAAQDLSPAE